MQEELFHLIYTSAATKPDCGKKDLERLLEQCRYRNALADITGMLLFEAGSFLQVLEGDRQTLERIFTKISKDTRHNRVTKLVLEPIE